MFFFFKRSLLSLSHLDLFFFFLFSLSLSPRLFFLLSLLSLSLSPRQLICGPQELDEATKATGLPAEYREGVLLTTYTTLSLKRPVGCRGPGEFFFSPTKLEKKKISHAVPLFSFFIILSVLFFKPIHQAARRGEAPLLPQPVAALPPLPPPPPPKLPLPRPPAAPPATPCSWARGCSR